MKKMEKLIKKILRESDDMDWIRNTGQNKILTINKLKELFKENNIDVDWDIEYDRGEDGHGDYNEYFGKFYYDTPETMVYDGRSYFIELYEKENGHLFFYLYKLDEEYDKYYRDEIYSQIETSSKDPEKFWRTVGFLVLYQMGKIKPVRNGETEEETFDVENTIEESDDMDWIRDIPSNQKVKPWNGNIGYHPTDKTSPTYGKVYLYTDGEGVTREIKVGGLQSKYRTRNYKGEWIGSDGEVSFYGASIMDNEIESKNNDVEYPDPFEGEYQITMSRQEYNDNARKGNLTLTPNSNTVNESEEDFDWASGFEWSKDMLDSMLTDCKTLMVANFNVPQKQPYQSAGGPSVMYLTRCKEWWDYFGGLTLSDSGRGPAEWFTPEYYDRGHYGVIWNHYWRINKKTPTLEMLDDEYTSAITTEWGYGIERQLNGTNPNEAWFVVDENSKPIYDLIPPNVQKYAKIYEEEFFGDKLNESDDFDWAREIPGIKEYGQKYRYFEIIACYGIDYETEECDDEYSHHIRIPSDVVDEIWDIPDSDFDYLAGPGDEAEGVIMYAIDNGLIPPREMEEIAMFQGVREEDDSHFDGIDENINESEDFDWVKDVPLIMNVCEAYNVLKVGDEIIIDEIDSWEGNSNQWGDYDDVQTFYNVKAKVLALDKCNNIHRSNEHNGDTILVSIEEDGYYGFDDLWVSDFTGTLPSQCQRDNCMFLLCNKNEPYQIQLSEKSLNESTDLKWIQDIEPSWLKIGQKFTSINNVRLSRRYEPKDKVQVGGMTFEIYDINNKHGEPHLRFTHNDVMDGRNWERKKENELSQNYGGIKFTQAKHNIDTGFWIPLTDCEFIESSHPNLVGKTKSDGSPYGHTYCKPNMSFGGNLNESNEFDWVDEIPSDYYPPDLRSGLKFLEKWVGQAYQTDDEIGLSVQDVKENPSKDNIQDLINVLKHWTPYVEGDEVYWAVEDLISSINPHRFKDVSDRGLRESKKTIKEAAGISFEARKWGEIIYNEIMDNPNEKKRLIIDGYDHPEAFDGFPIDYVVIDFYDRLTGYGQEHSGYDKDGNYVVLLYIQPKLVQGQGGYDLRSVLNHEMKHAWEDYNRLSKGLPSIEQTKESQDLYNRDFILMLSNQNIVGPIKEILKYYYYLSDLEKSAYLENVYDQNIIYEKTLREIISKDFSKFKGRFDLDINWHLMNTAYDIPFLKKFKSPTDFIDYSAKELRSKALKMIKKVNKMKYIHKK